MPDKIRNIALGCLLVLFSVQARAGYGTTPAIIQVPADEQHDSVGFNIALELPKILYPRILDGTVPLWESPLKDQQVSGEALMAKERTSKTSFTLNKDLFIDEDWKLQHRDFEFTIRGFFFLNRSSQGQQVKYGYVDVNDVTEILKSTIIPTNANGSKDLTFWDALQSKRYNFRLVKFGTEDLEKNPGRSFELRDEAFFNEKVTTNAYKIPDVKEVELVINPIDFGDNKNNTILFKAVEDFFNQNRHEFFNLGGAEFEDFLNPNVTIHLTKMEVIETWTRTENGIKYNIDKVIFYVNNHPLQALSSSELDQLGFLVKFQPITDFLKSKNFFFTLVRINDQSIYTHNAQVALNALLTEPWDHILFTQQQHRQD